MHLGCAGLMALVLGAAGSAAAQPEPQRNWPVPAPALAPAAQSWADPSGTASLDLARAAFQAGQGQSVDPVRIMPLGGDRAVWYQLPLPPVASAVQTALTLNIPGIDRVELHRQDPSGAWQVQRAGDAIPVAQWPVRYLHPAFIFTVQGGLAQRPVYMKVQHSHGVAVNWMLGDVTAFDESSKVRHLLLGCYIGIVLLVIFLSAAHAVAWRDPIHVYYGIHVALMGLATLQLTGLAGEYLWPSSAWWNDIAAVVLPAGALGALGLFVRELVAERERRVLSWLLLLQAGISLFIVLGFLRFGRNPLFGAYNLYALVSLIFFLGVMGWYSVRRPQVGWWIVAGLGVLAAGAFLPIVRNLGFQGSSIAAQYALQIAGAVQMPLVLLGLYFRGRERRDNKLRIDALARTDPLTGVGTHRVLSDHLGRLLDRSRNDRMTGAVLRVRVANLGAIADEFGREAGEAAMVRAAECVTREAREGDTVAREQGGDLVLLMEGRITREQATAAARDIVAGGLKFSGWLPPGVTLSLNVAGAYAPLSRGNGQLLLGVLAQVLQDIACDPSGRALRLVSPAEITAPGALAKAASNTAESEVDTDTERLSDIDTLTRQG
jgi:two-component system, sensor histidine kinase LadS